jgi:Fanconi-associated nuclease 1
MVMEKLGTHTMTLSSTCSLQMTPGYCIILNESVLSLFRRIHVVYFRTSVYDPQLFVPAILVRCKKRNYMQYEHHRTEGIFCFREELLEYEEALSAEAKMELARDAYTTGITKGSGTAQKLFEEVYTWVHMKYAEQVEKVNVKRFRKDSLERFETGRWSSFPMGCKWFHLHFHIGHVLVRILHHSGELVNKIKGPCAEAELLRMLLRQTRWKRGSRG